MIAIYARVSTQEQAQNGHSIDEQIERMEKYCDAMDWRFKKYVDAGHSGASTDRPALQQMIYDIKQRSIERVLVYKLDRLSRSQKDTLMLIEDVFLKNGCDFVSISENFDTSSPLGRAMIGILAVFAQLEREQIKERMHMGKEARAKQGKFGSGIIPIGYDYKDGKLIPNEFEKTQVIKIFEDYVAGLTPYQIAKRLNDAGFSHKYGKWSHITIRKILKNRTYTGMISFGGEWFDGEHAPIIPPDLFAVVQKRIERTNIAYKEKHQREGRIGSYLAGFIYCKKCGAKYIKQSCRGKGHTYIYYMCNSRSKRNKEHIKDPNCKNKSWRMETLDQMILDEIRKLTFESPRKESARTDDRPALIVSQIAKIDAKIAKIIDLYTLDSVPLDALQAKMDDLNEQKTKLLKELDTIEQEKKRLTLKEACSKAETLDDVLATGNLKAIHQYIGDLIDRIEIDGENVLIHWAFT